MRSEQLSTAVITKYFEPQRKLRARLGPLNRFLTPPWKFYITDRSNAVPLMWFSVLFVLVSVSKLFSPSVCLGDFNQVIIVE